MNPIKARMYQVERDYDALPHSPARLAAIQSAIREADASGDRVWRLRSRYDAIFEQLLHGDAGQVLPLAAEFITLFEEQPLHGEHTYYLHILSVAVGQWDCLPQLPLEQGEQLMAHFQEAVQRYQEYDGVYYQRRFYRANYQGQRDKMEDAWNRWQTAKSYHFCPGCKQHFRLNYAIANHQTAAVKQESRPLLDGTAPCEQEPKNALDDLLDYALDHKMPEEAAEWASLLQRELTKETPYMEYNNAMLRYLAHSNPEEGLRMLERAMPEEWQKWSQMGRFYFFRAAWNVCRSYGEETISVKLPEDFPLWREDGQYPAKDLADWFHAQAQDIAQAFTARDGYPFYEKALEA